MFAMQVLHRLVVSGLLSLMGLFVYINGCVNELAYILICIKFAQSHLNIYYMCILSGKLSDIGQRTRGLKYFNA